MHPKVDKVITFTSNHKSCQHSITYWAIKSYIDFPCESR